MLFRSLQVVACGSRDDDLLCASLNVSHALLLAGVEAGALQNDINVQLAPRSILCVLNSVDLDLLAVDDDGILGGLDSVTRLAALESIPARRWEQIANYTLTAALGAGAGIVLAHFGL